MKQPYAAGKTVTTTIGILRRRAPTEG